MPYRNSYQRWFRTKPALCGNTSAVVEVSGLAFADGKKLFVVTPWRAGDLVSIFPAPAQFIGLIVSGVRLKNRGVLADEAENVVDEVERSGPQAAFICPRNRTLPAKLLILGWR